MASIQYTSESRLLPDSSRNFLVMALASSFVRIISFDSFSLIWWGKACTIVLHLSFHLQLQFHQRPTFLIDIIAVRLNILRSSTATAASFRLSFLKHVFERHFRTVDPLFSTAYTLGKLMAYAYSIRSFAAADGRIVPLPSC